MRGVHLLSIYVPRQGLVLAQAEVDRKENEIVVAPKVLKQVNLSGTIVIEDAMHAQRETSAQMVESGGDYLWTVKGNQPEQSGQSKDYLCLKSATSNRALPFPKIVEWYLRCIKGMDGLKSGRSW